MTPVEHTLIEAAKTDPNAADVLADHYEEHGNVQQAKFWRKYAQLGRLWPAPQKRVPSFNFQKTVERTVGVRKKVPAEMLPLFDHLLVLARSSYEGGYFKRAGQELLKARKLTSRSNKARVRAAKKIYKKRRLY